MGVVKGSKNVKINGTVKGSSSVRVDTARVNAQNATIRRECEDALKRINDYQGRIKDRKYLSVSNLDDMKSAIDTFEARGNTIRNLNSLGGYKYSDDENKAWEDSISSLRSGYESAKDLYSLFKTEDEFNKGMKDARIHTEKMAIDVRDERGKINDLKKKEEEAAAILGKIRDAGSSLVETNELRSQFDAINRQIKNVTGGRSVDEYVEYLDEVEEYQDRYGLSSVSNRHDFDIYSAIGKKGYGYVGTNSRKLSDEAMASATGANTAPIPTDIPEMITLSQTNNVARLREDPSFLDRWRRENSYIGTTSDFVPYLEKEEFAAANMTDDEFDIYNYHLAMDSINGTNNAERYIDYFYADYQRKKAQEIIDSVGDNGWLTSLFSINAGLENFSEGWKNALYSVVGEDEARDPTAVQIASGVIREKQNWFGKTMYDLGVNLSQQAPNTLVSFLSPGAGLATMGVSAYGNAYNDALNSGMSVNEARTYGLFVGASEVVLGKLLDTTIKGGGALTKKITDAIPVFDSALANIAKTQLGMMASEFTEESLQTVLEPVFEALATREDIDWSDASAGDVVYSGLLGALSALVLGNIDTSNQYTVAGAAIRAGQTKNIGKSVLGVDNAVQRLAEAGSLMSADSVAYKVAQKVNDKLASGQKVGAYTIGKLFNAENAYLTEQNRSDIVKSLTRKGVTEADAKTISLWMAEVVNGAELDKNQQSALEDNDNIAQTYVDVILNPNSTVAQRMRSSAINEVATAVAQRKTSPKSTEAGKSAPTQENISSISKDATEVQDSPQRKISPLTAETKLDTSDYARGQMRSDYESLKRSPDTRISSMSEDTFVRLYSSDYLDAYLGETYDAIKAKASSLPESVRRHAYELGFAKAEARKANAINKQKAIDEAKNKAEAGKGKGAKVGKKQNKSFYDGDVSTLTDIQRDSIEVLDDIFGGRANIKFINSYTNEDGVQVYKNAEGEIVSAPNGITDEYGNIVIDLNSGEYGEGVILYSAAHELTHVAEISSPKLYEAYAKFLAENYPTKKGNTLSDEINYIMKWSADRGVKLTLEEARREFVARASEKMLVDIIVNKDNKSLEKLGRNKRLFTEIISFINELFEKLSARIAQWYGKIDPSNEQAKAVQSMGENLEKLRMMWAEMVGDAVDSIGIVNDANINVDGESASPMNSLRTWLGSEYVINKNEAAEELAASLGVTKEKALRFINDVNSIAKVIANDKARLDYEASSFGSAFVSNVEYGGSFDYTTLCAKRRIYTGTFQEIQKSLRDIALTPEDILTVRNMLIEKGYEATCGLCYVEGSRANMGKFAKEFIRLYKRDNPNAWIPDMVDVNTPDGVEQMRINHPECYEKYEYFWNHYGKLRDSDPSLFASQQKPKLYEARKEYKGEILEAFKKDATVSKKNLNGGIRMQSFSDFEIVHLIDTMQVIMDMSRVGLAGQAYTKVPEFAKAFGNTGLKINLSLIAKGVDENGKLVFDDREGMPHETAFDLRNQYSENVGTIIVIFTDEQLTAAMADPRIDFIIPFHRSQWKKGQYAAMGLPKGTKDYTYMQNEKLIKKTYHEYHGKMVLDKAKNYMPNEYWDFSKSGKENAETYLKMCAENNKRPKFYKLLDYNGDGSYSLKQDGSTDGYWKLLIDFKMYNNNGVGSPQMAVQPEFNMDEAATMLNEYKGGHQSYPVAYDVVDRFVSDYKSGRKTLLPPPGKQFSLRNNAEVDDYSKPITAHDVETLRSIRRKSINDFTSEEIKKAQKWAYKFYKELGTKSPFFRAWFGEWRAHADSYTEVVDKKADQRKTVVNEDTKWEIQTSKKVHKETSHHSGSSEVNAVKYLPYIDDITKKAVLFDSVISDKDNPNSLMFHTMYAYTEVMGYPALLKLKVEELFYHNTQSSGELMRDYILQNIEEEPISKRNRLSRSNHLNKDSSVVSISDLYELVKTYDKDFSPAPEVSKYVLNKDGTPKVFYHGTKAAFTVFDKSKLNDRLGFYFTEDVREARDYGEPTGYYLNVRNPIDIYSDEYFDKYSEIKNVDEKVEALKADRYDGIESYSHGTQWIIAFDSTQIKSATDNIGTFDGNNSDIRYSLRNRTEGVGKTEAALKKENAEYRADVEHFKRVAKLNGAVYTKTSVVAATKMIMKNTGAKGNNGELRILLDDFYAKAAKIGKNSDTSNLSDNDVLNSLLEAATPATNWIVEHTPNVYDTEMALVEWHEAFSQVYDSLWRVVTLTTPAEKHKAEINQLKKEHRDKMAEIRKKRDEKIAQIKAENAKSREKAKERRNKSEVRDKIRRIKTNFESMLKNPTEKQYVPAGLVSAIVDVCDLINTDTDLYKKNGEINKAQVERNLTKEKLQKIRDEYEKLRNPEDPMYRGEFDDFVYEELKTLRDEFSGKNLSELSLDELRTMYEILKTIEETIRDARKLIGWNEAVDAHEVGVDIIKEQQEIRSKRKNDKIPVNNKMLNTTLSPLRNVERMTGYNAESYLTELFDQLNDGERKKNKFKMDAYKMFEALTTGENAQKYENAIYKESGKLTLLDQHGRHFGVSKMQMMQAILSWEREKANNLNHISTGGLRFADIGLIAKGDLTKAQDPHNSHLVNNPEQIIEMFKEVLDGDEWAQSYMTVSRQFFNETAKDAINEVSLATKHRIVAKDKAYIPFEVDITLVYQPIDGTGEMQKTIDSYGMLKPIKNGAPQPLIISGLNNVLDRHIEQVATIYGLAIPIKNFEKVWNVQTLNEHGNKVSVKGAVADSWGKEGATFIEQTLRDLQAPRKNTQSEWYRKIKSNYIGATFLLNLSVVFKQIGSMFSATSMIGYRSPAMMLGNLVYTMMASKKISAEVDKYTATAWTRRQGLSDAELSTLLAEGKKSTVGRLIGKAPSVLNPTKWIQGMDSAVALSLWKYCKKDIAKRTGLTGEALLEATAEFYNDVIENTQSMNDVLHRPEIQKTGNTMSELFGTFKTDLYQMAGQLQTAKGRFSANKDRQNLIALTKTSNAIIMSAVWASVMTSLFAAIRYKVDRYRDEDDEDITAKSWFTRSAFALVGDLAGYVFPLVGGEIIGLVEQAKYGENTGGTDSIVLSAVDDVLSAAISVASSTKDDEFPKKDVEKLITSSLQLLGVPSNNISRALKAFSLHLEDIRNGKFLSFEAGVERSSANHAHRILEAFESGDTDKAKDLFEEAVDEIAARKADGEELTEDDIKDAMSDIKSAIGKKYKDGEVDEKTAKKILSELFGMSDLDIYWKLDEWDYAVENGSSDGYSKYDDIINATEKGASKTVIADFISHEVNGRVEKERELAEQKGEKFSEKKVREELEGKVKSSVKSQITSHWKKMVIQAFASNNTTELVRIRNILFETGLYGTNKDTYNTMKQWYKDSQD